MRAETRARVLKAIEELDYTPAKSARALRQQRTHVIAILLPDISNPFFSLLARGVESVAFNQGYSTMICDSNHSTEKESRHLDILLAEGVEGIVLVAVAQPEMSKVERLLRRNVQVVSVDRVVEGLPTIGADNRGGSRALTEYVLSLGYQRIAYIAGPPEVSTARERLSGFLDAVQLTGPRPVTTRCGQFTYESGYSVAAELLRDLKVEAIMAANDLMALGAINAAEEVGLQVPKDLGVTGFDHVSWAAFVRPNLTSVEVPAYRMGQVAATQVLSAKLKETRLETRLIHGGTCTARR